MKSKPKPCNDVFPVMPAMLAGFFSLLLAGCGIFVNDVVPTGAPGYTYMWSPDSNIILREVDDNEASLRRSRFSFNQHNNKKTGFFAGILINDYHDLIDPDINPGDPWFFSGIVTSTGGAFAGRDLLCRHAWFTRVSPTCLTDGVADPDCVGFNPYKDETSTNGFAEAAWDICYSFAESQPDLTGLTCIDETVKETYGELYFTDHSLKKQVRDDFEKDYGGVDEYDLQFCGIEL